MQSLGVQSGQAICVAAAQHGKTLVQPNSRHVSGSVCSHVRLLVGISESAYVQSP